MNVRTLAVCFSLMIPLIALDARSLTAQSADREQARVITACVAVSPITLDGFLEEPAWKEAQPATDFIQRELAEGEPATEKTEVRILYDSENLYIGIMCYDSEPGKILHNEMERDAELDSDDNFTVVIDTFRDKRTGYWFGTNPNGVYKDALMSNGGHDESWNGVWDVRARITDRGWSAEMVIPFKTLRFSSTPRQDWGVNFERIIQRKREEALWTAWGRNDGIFQLSKCGVLAGLSDIKRSRQIDFKPYALGGLEKLERVDLEGTPNYATHNLGTPYRNFKYGLDVKYPITSQLTLDLTTLTDFAQVESDREQINLTRFDITYPEKRDFFLEGSDIFTFGPENATPFYSRRIGLTPDRTQVPILGGAKLVGKAGSYNIGVIEMQTDHEGSSPSTNFSIVRVKKDVLEKSYIGFIATNVSPHGGHTSQAYGVDFLYRTDRFLKNQNLEIGGYGAENRSPDVHHGNHAGRVLMNLPNDTYNVSLLYHAVGANFTPETGFVQRRDIRQYYTEFELTPRPGIRGIKKLLFMPLGLDYYTDPNSRLLTRATNFRPFGVEFNSGDSFEFNVYDSYEYVNEAIERFRGKMNIPVGLYRWWDYEFEVNTSESRPYSLGIHMHTGDFYNGKRDWVMTEWGMKTSKFYSLFADVEYQRISMNGERFNVRDYGARIAVNFTPRLTTSSLIQYNNESGEVNLNFRLHYIPKVGSDVYLVYNHLWDEEDRFRTIQNTGVFKITYLVKI